MRTLNASDVAAVSGAGLGNIIWKGLEIIGAIDTAKDFIDGFMEGVQDGYERERNK